MSALRRSLVAFTAVVGLNGCDPGSLHDTSTGSAFQGVDVTNAPSAFMLGTSGGSNSNEAIARAATQALEALSSAQNTDEALLELERTLPNLGGLYFGEDGATHVLLTDRATEAEALTARAIGDALAQQRASSRSQSALQAPTKVQPAMFRFSELKQFRDQARQVLNLEGVHTLDANERANRVSVGVVSEDAADRARAWWVKQQLPLEALEVSVQQEFLPQWTLNSYIRPTPGGYAIVNNYGGICTLGYPVYSYAQGLWGFITNSHCTNTQGGVEFTGFTQGGVYLATEYADPPYVTSAHPSYPACPVGKVCRFSDAAFAGDPYYGAGAFGKIANTINYCGLPQTHCSTTVDSFRPTNTPRTFASSPLVGQHFEKIGRTTGWTYGPINQTCVHINQAGSNRTILCEYTVEAGSAPGDSGSPVFTWNGTNNPIGGILWGGNSSNTLFVFSDYIGIDIELGTMAYY
jgi:hypothetical protein